MLFNDLARLLPMIKAYYWADFGVMGPELGPSIGTHCHGLHRSSAAIYNRTRAAVLRVARREVMADIERISAQQAHTTTKSNQALLVCAYEDEAKCRMFNLEGSISFTKFQPRAASLPKTQEIIFY